MSAQAVRDRIALAAEKGLEVSIDLGGAAEPVVGRVAFVDVEADEVLVSRRGYGGKSGQAVAIAAIKDLTVEGCEPKSPGADSGESPPADSAGGVATPEDEADMALFAPLYAARSDLGAVDRELERVGKGDGFGAILAATRAQAKVQAAANLVDMAWVDLGGEIPDAEEPPANGGTEARALDVTGFPHSGETLLRSRMTAAIVGYRDGAGAFPPRIRVRAWQVGVLGPVEALNGIPLEVVDDG